MALTLIPVEYGPDYTSRAAVEAALRGGKEFRVCDISSEHDGRVCNVQELRAAGVTEVRVRFKRLTQVTNIRL